MQAETPDDGQRNCPKHVEFHSKNKFEKLVHLVGFNIQIYHDARSHERQVSKGVKKNHVILRLTKKLEVLNMNLIAQTLRNLLYFIILWTVHLNIPPPTLGVPERNVS